jgi:branched-subunit amino acid ABC-type transport system permease component
MNISINDVSNLSYAIAALVTAVAGLIWAIRGKRPKP